MVCFDLDGTLIEGLEFSWQHIHDYLKTDQARRDIMRDKFFAKEISYEEWAMHDLMMWKEKGATREELIKALGTLRIMPGAKESIKELKSQGLKVGVISGSLDFILDHLFPNHPFDFVYMNKIMFNEDGQIEKVECTKFDFEKKAEALKIECAREEIDPSECVFIGDNLNDVQIAKEAGLSIAFNCNSEELKKVANHNIEKKDLKEILPLILK